MTSLRLLQRNRFLGQTEPDRAITMVADGIERNRIDIGQGTPGDRGRDREGSAGLSSVQ